MFPLFLRPDVGWPRRVMPCPSCQADYPTKPYLWGWIEDIPTPRYDLELCGTCEGHPAQWGEVDDMAPAP